MGCYCSWLICIRQWIYQVHTNIHSFINKHNEIKFLLYTQIEYLIYHIFGTHCRISLDSMIGADIAAATVLISMGALLGRTTPIQLFIMAMIEIIVFAANEYVQIELFRVCPVYWNYLIVCSV